MLRIGMFSRITQASIGQLRYYDEVGLLKPAHTDPQTGYRYYELDQSQALKRILALKDLGLPLEDIARLLHEAPTPEDIRCLLQQQKAQIEQALCEGRERLRRIEHHLDCLSEYGALPEPDMAFDLLGVAS
jgi:DNA-binding transcriptional MerR regulator